MVRTTMQKVKKHLLIWFYILLISLVVLIAIFHKTYVYGSSEVTKLSDISIGRIEKLEYIGLEYRNITSTILASYMDSNRYHYDIIVLKNASVFDTSDDLDKKQRKKQCYIIYGKTDDKVVGVFQF